MEKEYYLPEYAVHKILSRYKDNFVYTDSKHLLFNADERALSGNALYINPGYLKEEASEIFNNTEVICLFNQAMYLLMYAFGEYNSRMSETAVTTTLSSYVASMGNFVFGKMELDFKKPIFDSNRYIPFNIKIIDHKQYKDKEKNFLVMEIGPENNFLCKGVLFKLDHDLHGVAA